MMVAGFLKTSATDMGARRLHDPLFKAERGQLFEDRRLADVDAPLTYQPIRKAQPAGSISPAAVGTFDTEGKTITPGFVVPHYDDKGHPTSVDSPAPTVASTADLDFKAQLAARRQQLTKQLQAAMANGDDAAVDRIQVQ